MLETYGLALSRAVAFSNCLADLFHVQIGICRKVFCTTFFNVSDGRRAGISKRKYSRVVFVIYGGRIEEEILL